jgi:hypothetical protein
VLMSFGKYKGKPVETLPENYLKWLMSNIDLREPLLSEIRGILHEGINMAPTANRVKTVYRELSRKYHPDCGGNHYAQCAINEFYERLQTK